jgi:UDP-N-acetylglucosamine--N-acetylmuramyl-(pentapeptide) pyrophosphoryl-undecaprenol N-acetylglucosamine transferase
MKKINVLISAGGTGGHLIPAQQLARKLIIEEKSNLIFMAKGLKDNQNFCRDFDFHDISSGSLNKKNIFSSPFLILKGIVESFFYLLKKRIDVVVGFGSYHTFPVLMAAYFLKIPIVIFESNSYLGKVNRFFAKRAKVLTVQFKIRNFEKYKNIKLVPHLPWIPKEAKLEKNRARRLLGLKEELTTFLVFGGSQGASFINELLSKSVIELRKKREFQVIHLTGSGQQKEMIKELYDKLAIPSYVRSYEKEMVPLYSSADLAICRAGAATISELLFFELPAVLIPYPHASEDHQRTNGLFFTEEVKGGELFFQNDFDYQKFEEVLSQVSSPESKKLIEMKKNLCNFKQLTETEKRESLNNILYEVVKKP